MAGMRVLALALLIALGSLGAAARNAPLTAAGSSPPAAVSAESPTGAAAGPAARVVRALDAEQPGPQPPAAGPEQRSSDGRLVVVNIPAFTLYLFEDGRLIRTYPVGIGRRISTFSSGKSVVTETPVGEFRVVRKDRRPYWYPPEWLKRERGWSNDYRVPPGPENPLGTRWIAIWRPGFDGYGIHGTKEPASVGRTESLGCIRMHNEHVEELFELVSVGTPVRIIYEPVWLYRGRDGEVHLALAPDVYEHGLNVARLARRLLSSAGVDDSVFTDADLSPDRPRDMVLTAAAPPSPPPGPGQAETAALQGPAGVPGGPSAVAVEWRVGGVFVSRDAVREGGRILVPLDQFPPLLQKYFRKEDNGPLYLYGRPLDGVVERSGRLFVPLDAAAERFRLVVEWDAVARAARVHF